MIDNFVIKNENNKKTFECFLSTDNKFLNISYPSISVDEYDDYFDCLNDEYNIYDVVEELYFETDYINSLPCCIAFFKNLLKLEVSGSRFWNLTMSEVPLSIVTLILVDHSNLSNECIKGMDELINLQNLYLNYDSFYLKIFNTDTDWSNNENIPFPLIPNLKKIVFRSLTYHYDDNLINDWKEKLVNNNLFDNIKDKIIDIQCNDDNDYDIEIKLK